MVVTGYGNSRRRHKGPRRAAARLRVVGAFRFFRVFFVSVGFIVVSCAHVGMLDLSRRFHWQMSILMWLRVSPLPFIYFPVL